MIEFETYYSFDTEQVEYIAKEIGSGDYPFALAVYLKSGKKLCVTYKTLEERNRAKDILVNRIERAAYNENHQYINQLYLLENAVNRIDKRQLRIWRQLKALLQLKEEE